MLRKLTCAALVFVLSAIASADSVQWNNITSGNWENGANWNVGRVPTLADTVVAQRKDAGVTTINITAPGALAGKLQMKFGTPTLNINAGCTLTNVGSAEIYSSTAATINIYGTWTCSPDAYPPYALKLGGGGDQTINVYGLLAIHNATNNATLEMGHGSGGVATLTIYSGGVADMDAYYWAGACTSLIDIKSGGRLYIKGDARTQVNGDIILGRIVGNGIVGNLIAKYDGTRTTVQVPDPITVEVLAGTSAGWDFYDINTNIFGGNSVGLDDLGGLAAQWLNGLCENANNWCTRADVDGSGNVDFLDYALLTNDWSRSVADKILLQTIYGTSQDSAGNITANNYYTLNKNIGMAMALKVQEHTALDKAVFKCFGIAPSNGIRVRFYDVTGRGYLTYGNTITRTAPGGTGNTAIFNFVATTPAALPSHSELSDGRNYSDLMIAFGPQEVNAGEYLLVFDANGPADTWGNIIRGDDGESLAMGQYPDGAPLPKASVVTTSSITGNTYCYQLTGSADATYAPVSSLPAFQITLNQAPKVNAGPDQLIYDPANSVALDATVTDDGLPQPPAVTTRWTKLTGPGTVVFGDPNSIDTTATFSELGLYILRLTASDGQISSHDDITITRMPAFGNEIVYHVTNLNNSGAGSFASCLGLANTDGLPSRIVFDVGGTIYPTAKFVLLEPNTTITGANAPGSGITFDFGGLSAGFDCQNTGNNIFCNLYIRNTVTDSDGITIGTANNIVERCTFELCRDEGVSTTGPNARNNIVAFSRFESCGSQPGDGTNYGNGRGVLITVDSSIILVGNYINHCCRGVTINGLESFLDARHNLVENSLSPASGAGLTNAGSFSNFISNVSRNNATEDFSYKNNCTFYRSGNTGSQDVQSGTEVFSVITIDDTPFPSWLNIATTPASGSDVGRGTGPCLSCNTINYPPVVDAGNNQTIINPAFIANLNGTVTDDGLPTTGMVTTQWTKQSGPGLVTFGDADAVDTTATFSSGVYGTYVLRLTADDSELSAYDEVTINYLETAPANLAPVVNAGPDQQIAFPVAANLDGTVTDDGLPNPPGTVTTAWTMQSGPGIVTFDNAAAVDTTASFSVAGTYVLRLTANDSALTGFDEITIDTVIPPPPTPVSITYPASSNTWEYTVSWSPATGATSYLLERSDDGGDTWSQIHSGSGTSYAEFVGNGSYRYRVKAVNSGGQSDWRTGTYDCVVSIPPPPSWSESADYYVDGPSGSDRAPGTSLQPFKTFAKAVSTATAGKKVLVWGDQTYSGYVSFTISGTSASPITFKRDTASGTAVLDGAGVTNKAVLDTTAAGYIVVDGFKLTNAKFGAHLNGVNCSGWVIKNCRVTANTNHGISIENGDDNLLFNNAIYLNDNNNNGVDITSNALNTNVTQCSIYGQWMGVYTGSGGVANVRDCIITNNGKYGVRTYGGNSAITVSYSDVWSNGTNYSGGGVTVGDGCISADPLFVNPAAGDFHLGEGSPAHNTAFDGGDMGYRYDSSAL